MDLKPTNDGISIDLDDHEDTPPSILIVSAVAELTDIDPVALPPLFDVLDVDALDSVFPRVSDRVDEPERRLVFHYADCDVTVIGGTRIEVHVR